MAERTGVRVVLQRLGYVLEALSVGGGIHERVVSKVKSYPYQCLDSGVGGKNVGSSARYRLSVNITREELLGWMNC